MEILDAMLVFSLLSTMKAEFLVSNVRNKRANQDNFDVLLNIYKMNPLRESNVFRTFSNRILLPRPEQHGDMNINTKESGKEKQNGINSKRRYGEIFHYSKPSKLDVVPLNVDKIKAEKFEPDDFLDNLLSLNQITNDEKRDDDNDIFQNNLQKYGSNQLIKDDIFNENTNKMLPRKKSVHDKQRYRQNEVVIG